MANLYRKSSIEKLSNPEQLDRIITITSPMSWLALLGVVIVIVATLIWSVTGTLPTIQNAEGVFVSTDSVCAYYSQYSGTVEKVFKNVGDSVKKNEELAVIKVNGGEEYTIKASDDGKLTDWLTDIGTVVYAGAEIARYTPDISEAQTVICYVPVVAAKQLEKDMKVLVYPVSVDSQKYGHIEATVDSIGEYAVTTSNMWYVLGADNLVAEQFLSNGPVISVVCKIKTDSETKSGYYWSSENGKDIIISNGTFATVKIVTDESAPITKLFSDIKEKLEG